MVNTNLLPRVEIKIENRNGWAFVERKKNIKDAIEIRDFFINRGVEARVVCVGELEVKDNI